MRKKAAAAWIMMALILFACHAAPAVCEGTMPDYGEIAHRILYVSVSGSDEDGDGTQFSPWHTPGYAAMSASPGDTIRLAPGTYDIVSPIELPAGVSLEGAGGGTVLTSTVLTEEIGGQYAILRLVSPVGEAGEKADGSQHVSHIRFDGAGTATQAIEIQNRCNVAVHDCAITGFVHVGVGWRATDLDDETPPRHFVTGGLFYNNYMKDNSFYGPDAWGSVYGRGALFCGGLRGFEMYGNTIIEDCRTGNGGVRGVPVKFWYYSGWMYGCRIHDNVIGRLGSPTFSTDAVSWAFAVESMHHSGMEIYGNRFIGAVDLNDGRCGTYGGITYEYATWMHDNTFIPDPDPKQAHGGALYEETAIILEQRTERTLIERNTIRGYNQALYFNVREGVYDFTFRNNACTELGGDAGSMFRMDGHGSDLQVIHFSIVDNLFEGNPAARNGFGIIIGQEMGSWAGQDIRITGNAVGYTSWNWLVIDDYTAIDQLAVQENTRFETGDECRIRDEHAVSGYACFGNEEVDDAQWRTDRGRYLADMTEYFLPE